MTQNLMRVSQLLLLGMVSTGLGGLMACNKDSQHATVTPEVLHKVTLLTAQKAMAPEYIEATGTVRAAQSALLSSQVMGTVARVNVREGDRVRRGEVLITIDAAQQRSAYSGATAALSASQQTIAAADADYALAEATMQRYQALFDKKSVSPQEYDEVKTRLAVAKARRDVASAGRVQAEAAVAAADIAVGFTRIRAPFDGVVVAKLADASAMASPGVPLLAIEDPTRFRLEAAVDESQISMVRMGDSIPVVIDSLGSQTITGKVVQIVPTADPVSRTFVVKIDLPVNQQIRSGQFGRARFTRGERQAILVPQNALLHRGQLEGVYVVGKDNVATLRYVTVGKLSANQAEVLSGLETGDRIVAEPEERDFSGKQIGVR